MHQARLESINWQKSRELWLKEVDRNSKFFHLSIVIRRRRNNIRAIWIEGKWIQEEEEIAEFFIKNFQNLFSSNQPSISNDLDELIPACITEE